MAPAHRRLVAGLATAFAAGVACTNTGSPAEPTAPAVSYAPPPLLPFEPVAPEVYVAKVKNLLVGLPATQDEVAAVTADPAHALGNLIDGWMTYPQYTQKMQRFFELAFQQTQVAISDFAPQVYPRQADVNASTSALLTQNATESFARTMVELVAEGRPMTEAMTTQQFMMTPALMELYAFLDAYQLDDANGLTDRFALANPGGTITVTSEGPISPLETLDPLSPNYMHWYDPDVANVASYEHSAACGQDPIVYPASAVTLHYLLYGALDTRKTPGGVGCPVFAGTAAAPQVTGTDFTDWRMVTVRPPNPGESTTPFYALAALRASNELVLSVPRVGFFSTPAYFANWQTNSSNEGRVTTNQALIVALGASIGLSDPTPSAPTPGLDSAHATPDCYGCHRLLDPTRSILAANYSWDYHRQTDQAFTGQDGLFVFQNSVKPVHGLADFGNALATHPLFQTAWPQKLCYYLDSAPCDTTDPEFQRVVGAFVQSGYQWNTLVHDLASSPLVTYATSTQTVAQQGQVVAVSRRDHLCAALNARLGLTDVCGLLPTTPVTSTVPAIAGGLPSDGYGRGSTAPVLPNQPTLFYRAATENICEDLSAMVIDVANPAAGVRTWSSNQPTAAIADFVSVVMALPASDARAPQASTLLEEHYQAALQSGASSTDALRSTFTAACMAPSAISIGL
jgi:hypothetical protein